MIKRILAAAISLILCTCVSAAFAENAAPALLFEQAAQTEDVKPANSGTLQEDNLVASMRNGVYCVFGSDTDRSSVKAIHFLNNTEDAPDSQWDVSAAGDGSVTAWIVDDTLYIAGDGGVKAPNDCTYMFSLYRNLTDINFGNNFDTSDVKNMTGMFAGCASLKEIDLNSLDVSNVVFMDSMFESCDNLQKIHASDWKIDRLASDTNIFNGCNQLGFTTIDGLWSEKYEAQEAEAAEKYPVLTTESRGDAVADLQQHLMDLGYSSITKADGVYGGRTATAVHSFKKDHNIYDDGAHDPTACKASALMQKALYEGTGPDSSVPAAKASAPAAEAGLVILKEDSISAKNLSDNRLQLTFKLRNDLPRTIVGYTMIVYTTGIWGDQMYVFPIAYPFSSVIEPNETVESGKVVLKDRGKIANLYIGILNVSYDDGSVIELPDTDYLHFSAVDWL